MRGRPFIWLEFQVIRSKELNHFTNDRLGDGDFDTPSTGQRQNA
jgi:hypothetical protein